MSETLQTTTITDRLGRSLEIRELAPLEEMDLLEAAGDAAGNRRWWTNCALYACIRKIDGTPMPLPVTRPKIRAHIQACGAAGIAAVIDTLTMLPDEVLADAAPAAGDTAAKN